MKPTFAIVGGSIVGSVCAILLDRLGFDVVVFEKSKNEEIPDRGAGIWLPKSLIDALVESRILSRNFQSLSIQERPIYFQKTGSDEEILLTAHSIQASPVHWLNLYQDIKKHRPEKRVVYDAEVTHIESGEGVVGLTINGGEKRYFDYCIFADGSRSLGRSHLFPDLEPIFTDTVVWRGNLNPASLETAERVLGKGLFYVNERGHLLIYPIPRLMGSAAQHYEINWLFYERVDSTHALFKGSVEKVRRNIAKGHMPDEYRDYLHGLAETFLPTFPRKVVVSTKHPFMQSMHEILVPSYVKDNMCLVGDASTMLRAHTAAGTKKGIQDALALGKCIKKNPNQILLALKQWNATRYEFGKNQFELGQALGGLFVTHAPHWPKLNKVQMDAQWLAATRGVCWYSKQNTHASVSELLRFARRLR